jgi:hypothetical protein
MKIRKQNINIVFNYSKLLLTESMEEIINLGLNLSIRPLKLDISQVLTDFRRFEKTMFWKEFWYKKLEDSNSSYVPPIFKTNKYNFPRKHKTPVSLKTFLGAVKSLSLP